MDEFRPLLMSQATIYHGRLYIPSTGEAQSCLYVYDINTGEQLANPELPTRYNIYAPVVNHMVPLAMVQFTSLHLPHTPKKS